MIIAIIVGVFAGFLAGKILNGSGYGMLADLALGFLGGIVGRIAFGLVGIRATGLIGSIVVATCGALMLIWITRWVRSGSSAT